MNFSTNKKTFKIRLANTSDAPEMLEIYHWYIRHTAISFELNAPQIPEFINRMNQYQAEAPWLVCEIEKKIAGFAYASPHRSRAAYQWNREISIYLDQNFHGKGIARPLYITLFQLLERQGYCNLLAGIVTPNPKSEKFHIKMGFQKIGTYHHIGNKFGKWWNVDWYELFLQEEGYAPRQITPLKDLPELPEYWEFPMDTD